MPEEKGLNRGGTSGQEGELNDGRWREPTENKLDRSQLDRNQLDRDREKQRGGIGREPGLNPDSQRQEKHISD